MSSALQQDQAQTGSLIPVACFLHRIFPAAYYDDDAEKIVETFAFKPRKDCEEVELSFPLDWEALNSREDRNWRMQLQGWTVFHPMMNFFDGFDKKEIIVRNFLSLVRDWWDNYGADPDDIVTSRMPDSYAWYDMSVGFRALIIAFFRNRISAHAIAISSEDTELLEALAAKHILHLGNPATFSLNNHGMFQAQGLMALVQVFESGTPQENQAHFSYALELMERLVKSQFDLNGIHLEHSPHYHFYALATFEAVMKSGWYDASAVIVERIDAARDARKWLVDPLRRPICIGDSILTEQKSVKFPKGGSTKAIFSDFDSSGYSAVRSDWGTPAGEAGMVFLMGGFHTTTHKHRDCLSFDWFDRGQRVICDGGKYGYKSDRNRHYALSYRAHNNAEIEGFDIIKLKPYGSVICPSEQLADDVVKMGGKLDFPAIKHDRKLYAKLGKWIIVEDKLDYAKARDTTLWFHLETDFRLVSQKGGLIEAKGSKGREVFIECTDPSADTELHFGNSEEMKGFVSPKDYQIEPALQVGFSLHGADHTVRTILALDKTALHEARQFASVQFGIEVADLMPQEVFQNPLPNIAHHVEGDAGSINLETGAGTYATNVDGIDFNFYCSRKEAKTGKLLIMFPGASARKNGHLDFQRYGWSGDFKDHDVIAFSDPTLKPENDIGLAWFQYHKDRYGIAALEKLLKALLRRNGYEEGQVCLFGSSGGGFVALQLANLFPSARVIAINPQLFLYNYSRPHYEKMLETCFPGMSDKEVFREYRDRIVAQMDCEKREAPTFIFQNVQDVSHLERHLRPFVKKQKEAYVTECREAAAAPYNRLNVILFDDPNSGHAPPDRATTVSMLEPLLI